MEKNEWTLFIRAFILVFIYLSICWYVSKKLAWRQLLFFFSPHLLTLLSFSKRFYLFTYTYLFIYSDIETVEELRWKKIKKLSSMLTGTKYSFKLSVLNSDFWYPIRNKPLYEHWDHIYDGNSYKGYFSRENRRSLGGFPLCLTHRLGMKQTYLVFSWAQKLCGTIAPYGPLLGVKKFLSD